MAENRRSHKWPAVESPIVTLGSDQIAAEERRLALATPLELLLHSDMYETGRFARVDASRVVTRQDVGRLVERSPRQVSDPQQMRPSM